MNSAHNFDDFRQNFNKIPMAMIRMIRSRPGRILQPWIMLRGVHLWRRRPREDDEAEAAGPATRAVQDDVRLQHLGVLYTETGQTLEGSFSAVSKPIFATKYSF